MSFSVYVDWNGTIRVTRLDENGKSYHNQFKDFDSASSAIRLFLKMDLEAAKEERYIPEVICEGRAILRKRLKEREKKGNHYAT